MSQTQGKDKDKEPRNHSRWTAVEEKTLVSAMHELVNQKAWKADNGQFKNGAYAKLEALMEQNLPGCGKKAKPHIESKMKAFRKHYDAITKMLSPQASGFGWNDEGKFVTCPESVWDEWVKSHKNAVGLRNKPFPLYDELGKIFGKDRANGNEGGSIQEVLEEMETEEIDQSGNRDEVEDQIPTSNIEGISSPTQTSPGQPSSVTSSKSRTNRARTETIEALRDFSTKIDKMSDVMISTGEHIGRLASCFQHESDSAERRMNVTSEIMKIEGFLS